MWIKTFLIMAIVLILFGISVSIVFAQEDDYVPVEVCFYETDMLRPVNWAMLVVYDMDESLENISDVLQFTLTGNNCKISDISTSNYYTCWQRDCTVNQARCVHYQDFDPNIFQQPTPPRMNIPLERCQMFLPLVK